MKTNIFFKYMKKDWKSDNFGGKKGRFRRALKKKAKNEFNKDFLINY
jgi:flavodoxin